MKCKKPFTKKLRQFSNPVQAQKMAYKYLGKTAKLCPSDRTEKKYKIFDPNHKKWVNFGQIGYQDFTRHKNLTRRHNYLTRTKGMLGNWKNNPYSPNNLSRHILW